MLGRSGGMSFISVEEKSQIGVAMLSGEQKKCNDVFGSVSESSLRCLKVPNPQLPEHHCRHRIHVRNHGYIGGAYGHGNEEAMKDALLRRGPFAASIEPTPEFGVYKNGIFHTSIRLTPEYREGDASYPWIKVDHAVLIVGIGVAIDPYNGKGIPFWRVQNSWGDRWGENGYFRVLRGNNEMAVEQSPVEGDAVLEDLV
ncbi:cathepsin C-like [Condylostylus longicornis]|uniref:cathepsin C-like n=1 Tax=Condylostylus longicornis TaxID=2530218 RepID=UPI00244DF5EF|nr:cathepsin C-like [Condylostylus longicornis]